GIFPIDAVGMRELVVGSFTFVGARRAAAAIRPLPLDGGMTLASRTISFGGLSSRTPWKEACRTRSPCVQPWKATSMTMPGLTHLALRALVSSLGGGSNGDLPMTSGCNCFHR